MKKNYLHALYASLFACLLGQSAVAQTTQLDPTFQLPAIMNAASPGTVYDVVQQADGKYIIGGAFTSINGVRARNLARLNADGTLDVAFTANCAANRPVVSLALQPDGRVLAGGQFDSIAGASRQAIARLLPAGGLDATFNTALSAPTAISQVALLPGGDVLTLSPSAPYYGNGPGGVVQPTGLRRLNGATGQPLPGFQPAVHALCMAVQPDGKIITGGGGASYITMHLLARLLPDGSLDQGFTPLTTYYTSTTLQVDVDANSNVYRLGQWNSNAGQGLSGPGISQNNWGTLTALGFRRQPNGRFLISGRPASANEPLTARLLPNGQQDAAYLAGNGPRAGASGREQVYRFLVQPDGAIMMAGNFALAGTTPVWGLVRMRDANVLTTRHEAAEQGTTAWPVPATTTLNVGLAAAAHPRRVKLLDSMGRVVLTQAVAATTGALTLDVAALPAGAYALCVDYERAAPVVRRVVLE